MEDDRSTVLPLCRYNGGRVVSLKLILLKTSIRYTPVHQMAFATIPFDMLNYIMQCLTLKDLLHVAEVHMASNRRIRLIIAKRDPHDLLKDSHQFISWNNWKAALCAIIKTIRRPGAALTYGQRLFPRIHEKRNSVHKLAVHITADGIVKWQMSYDWQISVEEWVNIAHVVSPTCINCSINTKRRA